jgi:hypothetical protein
MDKNYDRLCNIQDLCEILNKVLSKFYSSSKHLALDEVVILLNGRVVLKLHSKKKKKAQMFWHESVQIM